MKKLMGRIISTVLALSMVTSILPMATIAQVAGTNTEAEEPIYVLAGSDFQPTDGKTSTGVSLVNEILEEVEAEYPTMDGFLFTGDYDYNYNASKAGKDALQGAVKSVYPDITHEVYVEGNHDNPDNSDNEDLVSAGILSPSGVNDAAEYGVYVIHESDYMWYNDEKTTVQETAAALDAYLDAKIAEKYDQPIFVVSHLPLHYSMRTKNDGDGMYANYIFDVLNEAGENGLNIIFLFGHNHSNGWDDYLGGAAIYLEKGDSINIAQASKTAFQAETLNFTYMNAGYVAYYRNVNTGSETDLTMTVFEITDDAVTVNRFSSDGLHDVKSAGVTNSYKNETGYAPNTTVYTSPQTIELAKFVEIPEVSLTDAATGVSVTAPGITGLTVAVESKTVAGYTAYLTYDIVPADYTQGDMATVTVPVTEDFDASKPVVVLDQGEVISSTNIVGGRVTFTTNHFSEYAVAQVDEVDGVPSVTNWVTITEPIYTYTQVTEITAGGKYVIVGNNHAVALMDNMDNNGTMGKQNVTISGTTMTSTTELTEWTFSSSSKGTVCSDNNRYIRYNNSFSLHSNKSTTLTFTDNDSNFSIYNDSYWDTYFYYNGSSWTGDWSKQYVRLYQPTDSETTVTYAGISGVTTYTVVNGTSETDALAQVKAVVDAYKYEGMSDEPDPNEIQKLDDGDENLKWQFNSYDGTTPGNYTVTISYQNIPLGTVTVTVPKVAIKSVALNSETGSVRQDAGQYAQTGAAITVILDNDTSYQVPVTVSMLSKDGKPVSTDEPGTLTGLTVTYVVDGQTKVLTNNFTLEVKEKTNYPEYPDEGAVKVNKTATGIDFQSSGIAQVEVSASGVPSKKGADVIVMLDLSSSMDSNSITENGQSKTRLQVLRESLTVLLQQLQANGEDGTPMDIRIAVADFHRYYTDSSSPYYINSKDHLAGGSIRTNAEGTNKVYTGKNGLNADAFVDVHSLANNAFETTNANNQYYLGYKSGTNYDYAFDAIYQLGEAITAENEAACENRDLFFIFMSDGAPFQFNYFSEQSSTTNWNNWLQGTMTDAMFASGSAKSYYNAEGKHWMAEAIKGDPDNTYPVIRKNNAADTDGDNWVNVKGLGAEIYSIGFCLAVDKQITVDSMVHVIGNIASDPQHYFRADTASELSDAFSGIGSSIAYAANNARFVDQMGDSYSLQMKPATYSVGGGTSKTLTPKIEIISYDIYTKNDQIPAGKNIGDRKGGDPKTLETVTFSADGKEAYSTKDSVGPGGNIPAGQNILSGGVIYASSFWYNSNTDKSVTLNSTNVNNPSSTGDPKMLQPETFYWNMGTVQTTELAMRYYVFLEGAMDGTRAEGSYATNEFATLYYDNYLGKPCYKETTSPTMAWESANVSYAFYLVNDKGEVVVNQATGQTGSFANKIAVTQPVVYEEVLLNNTETVSSLDVAAMGEGVLPKYYTLYDQAAQYKVQIKSNATGSWTITKGEDKVASTYVTNYNKDDPSAYSNADTNTNSGDDYTHTTVWFAVLWSVQAHPDTVIIDYGLPVDITVLGNDMFGDSGKLSGVGPYTETLELDGHTDSMAAGFGTSYTGAHGDAVVNGDKVRYTPKNMQMNGYERFAYAAYYNGNTNSGYYYDTVTVIPATTIYYEDSFVKAKNGTAAVGTSLNTTTDGTQNGMIYGMWYNTATDAEQIEIATKTQDEDRLGKYSLPEIDANNVYGYDSAYKNCTEYSLGSAEMVTVSAVNNPNAKFSKGTEGGKWPTATFTFTGTGFDIVSLTDSTTGLINVKVYQGDYQGKEIPEGTKHVKSWAVDTYYGYDWGLYNVTYTYTNGEWVQEIGTKAENNAVEKRVDTSTAGTEGEKRTGIEYVWAVAPSNTSLYQIPVIKSGSKLAYGTYTVVITPMYSSSFDHVEGSTDYTFYLDAIRIYDPANGGAADGTEDKTIEDAYKTDGESQPVIEELRNYIIKAETMSYGNITGAVFIDGKGEITDITDYTNYGPNNEVYLAKDQAVAFNVTDPNNVEDIQIGMKSATGGQISAQWYNTVIETKDGVSTQKNTHMVDKTISTGTDMYYSIKDLKGHTIVIKNTGDGILSLTNIKIIYKPAQSSGAEEDLPSASNLIWIDQKTADLAVASFSLKNAPEAEEPDVQPEKPSAFNPDIFKISVDKQNVKVGDRVDVKVTASFDAERVVINGEVAKKVKTNNKSGTATWSVKVKAEEPGALILTAVAYDGNGLACEPIGTFVAVTEADNGGNNSGADVEKPSVFTPDVFKVFVDKDTVQVGEKVNVTVNASSDVKNVVINGVDAEKGRMDKKTKTANWTAKIDAADLGDLVITAVAYDSDGQASEAMEVTVTVAAEDTAEIIPEKRENKKGNPLADIMPAMNFKDLGGVM